MRLLHDLEVISLKGDSVVCDFQDYFACLVPRRFGEGEGDGEGVGTTASGWIVS